MDTKFLHKMQMGPEEIASRKERRKNEKAAEKSVIPSKPHHMGHRERLRQRFLKGGGENVPDYELIELLLFLAQPRGDMKPLAKHLLEQFGSFGAIMGASPSKLKKVKGVGETSIVIFKVLQECMCRVLRSEMRAQPILNTSEKVVNYCRVLMAHLDIEQFRMLFLDRKNVLIADEVLQKGTIDHTPLYPREVVKRAIELSASSMIMIHNHPSGDPAPSNADIQVTQHLKKAAESLEIRVLDHIIIGKFGYTSFREQALL